MHGMPVGFSATAGTEADCRHLPWLIEGFRADFALADRAYDADACLEAVAACGAEAVIPPKRNRIERRPYDEHLYKLRHLVENAFERIKGWRGLATRYCKRAASFEAAVQIRCLTLWLHIS